MSDTTSVAELRRKAAERMTAVAENPTREGWAKALAGVPEFAFSWGDCWKQCTMYTVDDLAAETGFYTEVLGFRPMILDAAQCMVTTPTSDFCIMLSTPAEGRAVTNASSMCMEFMIENLEATAAELERRGATFDVPPAPEATGSPLLRGQMSTPHGVRIVLWAMASAEAES